MQLFKYTGDKLPRISKKLSEEKLAFVKEQKTVREILGLPKEKALVFVCKEDKVVIEKPILYFAYLCRNGFYVIDCVTYDLKVYRIHADYLAEMQMSGFTLNEVLEESEN